MRGVMYFDNFQYLLFMLLHTKKKFQIFEIRVSYE